MPLLCGASWLMESGERNQAERGGQEIQAMKWCISKVFQTGALVDENGGVEELDANAFSRCCV